MKSLREWREENTYVYEGIWHKEGTIWEGWILGRSAKR
jgi:hypothetical protein